MGRKGWGRADGLYWYSALCYEFHKENVRARRAGQARRGRHSQWTVGGAGLLNRLKNRLAIGVKSALTPDGSFPILPGATDSG